MADFLFPAEEVRVQLLDLLDLCIETDNTQFVANLSAVCGMLTKVGMDPNPDMKNKFAAFSSKLALVMGKRVGGYMKGITTSLINNLQHQHSKVRRSSLKGLRDVLCCKGAECFMGEGPIQQLKFSMNDRSQDVRLEFYNVLFHWMKNMDIHYLKQYEADLV